MSISFGFTLNAFSIFTLPLIEMFECSHEEAARIATVFMISMTLAMPAAGWLLDHAAPRPVMAGGGLLTGLAYLAAAHGADLGAFTVAIALCGAGVGCIGLLCLLQASHPRFGLAAIVSFVLAWGTTFNLVNQMSPTLLMEFAGRRSFGSLLGLGNLISGLGAALGPMLFGSLVDSTKSYLLPLSLCAALMALALLPLALLRRAPGSAFEHEGK